MRRIVPKSLRGYSAIGEDCAPIWAIRGVNLEASYINEFAANTQGGMSREATYADQFYFGGSFDLERLVSLPGSKIVFWLTDRNGWPKRVSTRYSRYRKFTAWVISPG